MDIPAAKAFILHWGEMGSQWGVNRSVAQVHGLLYLSDRPLHADEELPPRHPARDAVADPQVAGPGGQRPLPLVPPP